MPARWSLFTALTILTLFTFQRADAQAYSWTKTSFPSNFATSVEVTPWGIMVGERNESYLNQSFNGVYISHDLGTTWETLALQKRKVTDLCYKKGAIYATTKDVVNNAIGLFVSYDTGNTWEHIGPRTGTLSVDVKDNIILLGTASHGLWVSLDKGVTWEQKIGDGTMGPDIWEVKITERLLFALAPNKVYVSDDRGITWRELPALTNKNIKHIESNKNYVLAGSLSSGIYVSSDYGNTWERSVSWGTESTGDINFFKGVFYAGRKNPEGKFSVYSSVNGSVWADTGLELSNSNHNVQNIAGLFVVPSKLFAVSSSEGMFEYTVPHYSSEALPFLETPWQAGTFNELVDKITSYFDHRYPLLGYVYHTETEDAAGTTVNYLGMDDKAPALYYSGHNGFDLSLTYGTPIVAAAGGTASYSHCTDCGHTIKIDHGNGYQTTYMHLQEDALITTTSTPVTVEAGDIIGKVGMSGRTTGPHLHFAVAKDKNGNGIFADDFPDGNVDPFGWNSYMFIDPWTVYSWSDILGEHRGAESLYLWKDTHLHIGDTFNGLAYLEFSNKKIRIDHGSINGYFTVAAGNYGKPALPYVQEYLAYIPHTSFYVNLFDITGGRINGLLQNALVELDFSSADLSSVVPETIKLYKYNETEILWEPTGVYILDLAQKKISAEVSGFSHFALFAEKLPEDERWGSHTKVTSATFSIQM